MKSVSMLSLLCIVALSHQLFAQQDQNRSSEVVSGKEIQIQYSGQLIEFRFEKKLIGTIELPKISGTISEVKTSPWMTKGIAVAIKTTDQNSAHHYHWATAFLLETDDLKITPTVAEFHNSKTNYGISGITNSESDSICIILLKYDRKSVVPFEGVAFLHDCPIVPHGGTLHTLSISPVLKN